MVVLREDSSSLMRFSAAGPVARRRLLLLPDGDTEEKDGEGVDSPEDLRLPVLGSEREIASDFARVEVAFVDDTPEEVGDGCKGVAGQDEGGSGGMSCESVSPSECVPVLSADE